MSKLSNLVNNQSIDFLINAAEEICGNPSEDVRLAAEFPIAAKSLIERLDLDPSDTNAKELYYALLAKYQEISSDFDRQLGTSSDSQLNNKLKIVANVLSDSNFGRSGWVLRKSVARSLLRMQQPKKLMKALNYRSVDSMLKRENIGVLYASLASFESSRWMSLLHKQYKNLTPQDFETRNFEVVANIHSKWSKLSTTQDAFSASQEMGCIVMWPNEQTQSARNISLCLIACDAISEMQTNQAWLKLHQFDSAFNELLITAVANDENSFNLNFHNLSWSSVAHNLAKYCEAEFPESLQPDLQKVDLDHQTALDVLSKVSPLISQWKASEHLIFVDKSNEMVSANLIDIAVNFEQKRRFNNRLLTTSRKHLQTQILGRYMDHNAFESYLLNILRNNDDPLTYQKPVNFSKLGTRRAYQAGVV